MRLIKAHFMRCATITLCMFVTMAMSYGQRTITGTITDSGTGEALIGATVIVGSTGEGAATDIDGSYSIQAETGDVLTYSYVGYADMTMTVGTSDVIDVQMQEGEVLDEVVVTGYQSQRKRDITGAVSVIDSDDLNVTPAASLSQKLAGKAAGVNISTSGAPGDGTAIRIRGFNSLSSNNPLIVVDGVPTKDQFLNSINPNDIESIQVLKDAASASVYGARGSNGVIIVTTKKGKAGKTKVSYNAYYGSQTPIGDLDLVTDADEFREYVTKAYSANPGDVVPDFYANWPDYYNGDPNADYNFPNNLVFKTNKEGTDWFDEVFNPAAITEHNLNVSGGNDASTFSVTGNYYKQDGTVTKTNFERYTFRANSRFNLGKFSFGENLSASRINQVGIAGGNQSEQNPVTNIIRIQPVVPVYDEGGNFAGPKLTGMGLGNNPVKQQDDDKDDVGNFNRLFGNIYGEFEIIEGLKARSSMGFDYSNGFSQNASFPNFEAREVTQRTLNYSENWNTGFTWTWTNTLSYVKAFNEQHSINAVVGYEAQKDKGRGIGGSLVDYFTFGLDSRYLSTVLADPATRSVGSGGGVSSYNSVFGKVDYSYDDFILASFSLRRDASSKFGPESRVGYFPAGSIGVRLTRFLNSPAIDDLKVRYGYGISGNDDIPGSNAFALFGGGTDRSFYAINGSQSGIATGFIKTNNGNPAGKWEELEQHNFGIDASFFSGKLTAVLDIYSKTTNDLLYNAANPGTGGFAAPAFRNVASMRNTGFDANFSWKDKINSNWSYNASLNLGSYKNEILEISDNQTEFFANGGSRIGIVTVNRVGLPIGTHYGLITDGIFASQAEVDAHADQLSKGVGQIRFKDINADGIINDEDKMTLGDFHPDLTMGLRLGANYKNWDFSTFIFGSFGVELFNMNKLFTDFFQFESNVRREVALNHWSPTNTGSSIPAPNANARSSNQQASDYYIEDGSYVRFENIQVGYTLPDIGGNIFSNARVYFQLQNFITLTNYSGIDPAFSNFGRSDVEAGVDYGNYPTSKVVMFGINLGF